VCLWVEEEENLNLQLESLTFVDSFGASVAMRRALSEAGKSV